MKRVILLSNILFLFINPVLSQDVIVTKEGTEIESKVTEITIDVIKYKKWDQQDGPVRNIMISEVFMIIYEDGTREIINTKIEDDDINEIEEPVNPDRTEINNEEPKRKELKRTYLSLGGIIELGYNPYFTVGLYVRIIDAISLTGSYVYNGNISGYDSFGFSSVDDYIYQFTLGYDFAIPNYRNLQIHGAIGYFSQRYKVIFDYSIEDMGFDPYLVTGDYIGNFEGVFVELGVNFQINEYFIIFNRLNYKTTSSKTIWFENPETGLQIGSEITSFNGAGVTVGVIIPVPILYKNN